MSLKMNVLEEVVRRHNDEDNDYVNEIDGPGVEDHV